MTKSAERVEAITILVDGICNSGNDYTSIVNILNKIAKRASEDKTISKSDKKFILSYISNCIMKLDDENKDEFISEPVKVDNDYIEEQKKEAYYLPDPIDGCQPIINQTYYASPKTVNPKQMMMYNVYAILNMHQMMGMPVLIAGFYSDGFYVFTNNISYQDVMNVVNNPEYDFGYFTDGNNIANLKNQ